MSEAHVTVLAYLAGAIDSDGTIGVKRSTYSMRVTRDSAAATYSERIALRQVTPEIPELLKATFGGCVYVTKPQEGGSRPLYSWQITDQKAARCARALLPFLRVKKAQAENVLCLRGVKEKSKAFRVRAGRGHVGSASRSVEHSNAMDAAYETAKALNHVGV